MSKKAATSATVEPVMTDSRISSTSSEDHCDDVYEQPKARTVASDHIDLTALVREADRYNLSDTAVAVIGTATLVVHKIVTKNDTKHVITRAMVRLPRAKYRKSVKILSGDPIAGAYFDGRNDDTNVMAADESGTIRYSRVKEEHYVVTRYK